MVMIKFVTRLAATYDTSSVEQIFEVEKAYDRAFVVLDPK